MRSVLLHDNARPHVTKVVKVTLLTLQWEVLLHAVYLPDCSFKLLFILIDAALLTSTYEENIWRNKKWLDK